MRGCGLATAKQAVWSDPASGRDMPKLIAYAHIGGDVARAAVRLAPGYPATSTARRRELPQA